jgi:hypothetical protein
MEHKALKAQREIKEIKVIPERLVLKAHKAQ